MNIGKNDVKNLRRMANGHPVAYVDRIRRKFRGEKHFASRGRHFPFAVSSRADQALQNEGWKAFYSPSLWLRDFPSMSALLLNAVCGFGKDATALAASRLSAYLDISRPSSSLGLVESVFAGVDKKPHAIIKVPSRSGGYSLHEFALVSTPEIMAHVGQSVEFCPPSKKRRARLRPISPPSVSSSGRIRHLSLLELVFIAESHCEKMDFAGAWKREPLPTIFLGAECLSEDLAGLYVHRETGEGILIFRGTRPLSLEDWLINVRTTHGEETLHHRRALATTRAAQKIAPMLMLAGHSKGGGLAQYVSAKTNLPAVTLNTVGNPSDLVDSGLKDPPTVEHFMIKFDPVSNIGGAPGKKTKGILGPLASMRGMNQDILGGEGSIHVLPPLADRGQMLSLHSLAGLKEVLRENPMVIPDPTHPRHAPSFRVKGMMRCPSSGKMLYEIDKTASYADGNSTRNILQSKIPALSKKRTMPSLISTTTVSRFL